ncbi:hypothetical protein G5S_0710 [Chlamydia pecorum E58]|uniref:Uncharacterized protein n=1 Tax=Chlamydia pecorum (strain ATCC VR-628 / DSM 29919 / E58) TaxID=331635 RepID=A0AA34RDB9_CHLPE|nr:hypothetical protein G5S_0710 [Chlamydia pecorum E58]
MNFFSEVANNLVVGGVLFVYGGAVIENFYHDRAFDSLIKIIIGDRKKSIVFRMRNPP